MVDLTKHTPCGWDECLIAVHPDETNYPLCWRHYQQMIEEEAADTAVKSHKEE